MTAIVNQGEVAIPMPAVGSNVTLAKEGDLNSRAVKYHPPASYREITKKEAGITLAGFTAVLLVAGALLWGICNNPTKSGCNQAIHDAGVGFTVTAIVLGALQCCFYSCVSICAIGAAIAKK